MKTAYQKIIILGGSSGIGLATAKRLANDGANVVITGRDEAKLSAAVSEIGHGAQGEITDAADEKALADFFVKIGDFDHLVVALSGAKGAGKFCELKIADLRAGFDAKFWLHVAAAQTALRTIRADGSITFISAASARSVNPGTAGLAAINGAIEAMLPTLAVELKPLRVNAVSPGVIDTSWWDNLPAVQKAKTFKEYAAKTPAGRIGKPEDIAACIEFLIANTFVTGSVVECDGGLRLVSG